MAGATRERLQFSDCVDRAEGLWDGDDAFGIRTVLVPLTAVWYRIAGAPVGGAVQKAADRPRSAGAKLARYGSVAFGFVFIAAILLVVVVRIL